MDICTDYVRYSIKIRLWPTFVHYKVFCLSNMNKRPRQVLGAHFGGKCGLVSPGVGFLVSQVIWLLRVRLEKIATAIMVQ